MVSRPGGKRGVCKALSDSLSFGSQGDEALAELPRENFGTSEDVLLTRVQPSCRGRVAGRRYRSAVCISAHYVGRRVVAF